MSEAIHADSCITQFVTTGGACYMIHASTDPLNNLACTIHIEPVSGNVPTVRAHGQVPTDGNNLAARFDLLTPRENEVARLIIEGSTNQEIAENLCISMSTVKCHIQNIFEKLKVSNRSMLASRYYGAAA